jgi:hypothetical protein
MLVLVRNFMDASATHMERPIGAYATQAFAAAHSQPPFRGVQRLLGGMCCNFVVEPKVGVDDRPFSSSPRTARE